MNSPIQKNYRTGTVYNVIKNWKKVRAVDVDFL